LKTVGPTMANAVRVQLVLQHALVVSASLKLRKCHYMYINCIIIITVL